MSLKAMQSASTERHSPIKHNQNNFLSTPSLDYSAPDTADVSPDRVMRLQRTMGNQATIQHLRQAQPTPHVQRLKKDKKTDALVQRIAEEIDVVESDVLACYEWAASSMDFEAFTSSKANLNIFLSLRANVPSCTAASLREQAGGDSSELVNTATSLIEAATQKKMVKETPKPVKEKEVVSTPSTKVPKELVLGESQIVAPTRPDVGSTFQDLAAIDPGKWPATFASTIFAIGGFTVGPAELLNGGKGTEKETVEVVIKLKKTTKPRRTYSFVVHYHPKAKMPPGVLNGHSDVHVKGDRHVKHHETLNEVALTANNIPSLQDIKDLNLQ